MKRYLIWELVEEQTLGFINEKSDKEFFEQLKPIQSITTRIYDFEKPYLIFLKSRSYCSAFVLAKIESLSIILKNCPMYLANCTSELSRIQDSHLLVFQLGRGYYALFTPYLLKNNNEK